MVGDGPHFCAKTANDKHYVVSTKLPHEPVINDSSIFPFHKESYLVDNLKLLIEPNRTFDYIPLDSIVRSRSI